MGNSLFGNVRALLEAKMAATQMTSLLCSIGNSSVIELVGILLVVSGAV